MAKVFKRIWVLALGALLVFVLDRQWGDIPAMGRLLTPFYGFFQQIEGSHNRDDLPFQFEGLIDEVHIKFDDRMVPHIFAQNDHDLYFAQGYIVARDRLWQMDFYTLLSAGRLTEVVGEAALPLDRYHRKIGLARTAEAITANLAATDSLSWLILQAYAAGVNAYIKELKARDLPIEYKILSYRPEEWAPYKSILMLMNMRTTLSAGTEDLKMTAAAGHYDAAVLADLFPHYPALESPIVSTSTTWDFEKQEVPSVPKQPIAYLDSRDSVEINLPSPQPEIGSNNWAVSGAKTLSGLPLLANDPHLQLTLPSIWYEMQLHSPEVNVYGVALPGTPAVIIGYNKNMAWGVTNTGSDVLDFYRIHFQDQKKETYLWEGSWHPVSREIETFSIKNGDTVNDTLLFTHHGPIFFQENEHPDQDTTQVATAMRWVANETDGSDLLTFHYLNRANNYEEHRDALAYYVAPAQNFVFASNENDIAITSNGLLPLKWKEQGKYLLDGTDASHDWQGWIDRAQNPRDTNPDRQFVSSANQFPADTSYPYYLGWKFAAPSRAIRINERLEAMDQVTASHFNDLLNDNFNVDARRVLPTLLAHLSQDSAIVRSEEYAILAEWQYENDANEIGAAIFETWIPALHRAIWEENFPQKTMVYPNLDRTYSLLLQDADSPWFDRAETDEIESKTQIIQESFRRAMKRLSDRYGPIDHDKWSWANVKATSIGHLVPQFKSFGHHAIHNGGGARIVNATTGNHGPSWRMIVQLDADWPQGYGIYPGGQSGNPGSRYYDNLIEKWTNGDLDTLLFLKHRDDHPDRIGRTVVIQPK